MIPLLMGATALNNPSPTASQRTDPTKSETRLIQKSSPADLAELLDSQRWTPSVGPLGGISKVDSAVLVAASKGNSERGRA